MRGRIEAEILDVFSEEVGASVDTPYFTIAGPKGDPGAPGKDGHSPVVTASKTGKTTTISVDGTAIATIEDGADGAPGKKGADGHTPVRGTDYWTAADKQEIIDDIRPAYYIDLAGTYPNYTCPVTMDDIKAAYNSGYNIVCRCALGSYTVALPLFVPMPSANTWIFSGSGALASMGFPAQSFTVAITGDGVVAQQTRLARADGTLPNPHELQITVGNASYLYDGSKNVNVVIDDGTEVSY